MSENLTHTGHSIVAELSHLRRYAQMLIYDKTLADDLVQDTCERAWKKRSSWDAARIHLRPWLFSIMHNLYIDQYRKDKRGFLSVEAENIDDYADPLTTMSDHTQNIQTQNIDTALSRLPPEQREVLLLVVVEELSYDQVAQVLEIPLGTVMSRLSRARTKLRHLIQHSPIHN